MVHLHWLNTLAPRSPGHNQRLLSRGVERRQLLESDRSQDTVAGHCVHWLAAGVDVAVHLLRNDELVNNPSRWCDEQASQQSPLPP